MGQRTALRSTPAKARSARTAGTLLVLGSAVLFSFSGVLTKAIDAGSWTILMWRGLIGAIGIGAYVWFVNRGRPIREVFRVGRTGWLVAAVGATGSIAFIVSFKNTYIANVSVIYATVPFLAALLERLIRFEPIRTKTLKTATASLVGVVVIVGGSLGSPNLLGDAAALGMVMMMALYMVLIRTFPDIDAVLTGASGGMLLFVGGWWIAEPFDMSRRDAVLLVTFGIVFAGASVLLIEGTRRLPAAEAGLLGTVETPVAIALAAVLLSEVPPVASIVGSAVVLVAVLRHAYTERSARNED
ncbi:MAG: DMT family transporter [Actinomycetota bacterium]